jgi:hypothetical protein
MKVSNIHYFAISQIDFDFGKRSHRARTTRQRAVKCRSGFIDRLHLINRRFAKFSDDSQNRDDMVIQSAATHTTALRLSKGRFVRGFPRVSKNSFRL